MYLYPPLRNTATERINALWELLSWTFETPVVITEKHPDLNCVSCLKCIESADKIPFCGKTLLLISLALSAVDQNRGVENFRENDILLVFAF